MSIYTIPALISFWVLIFLGFFIYFRDVKNKSNRIFFILCVVLALYAFAEFMYRQADSVKEAALWIRLAGFWLFTPAFFLHYTVIFTEKSGLLRKWYSFVLFYGPAAGLYYVGTFTDIYIGKPVLKYWGYTYPIAANHIPFIIGSAISVLYGLASCVILLKYLLDTKNEIKKRQSWYIIVAILYLIVSSLLTEIFPRVFAYEIPEMNTSTLTVFIIILTLAIHKYKLFILEPSAVSDKILSTLGEAVFLIEPGGRIASANPAAFVLSAAKKRQVVGSSIDLYLREPGVKEWLFAGNAGVGAALDSKISGLDGISIPVRLTRSELSDTLGRRYGIVLCCRDITQFREVQHKLQDSVRRLSVSNRELERFAYNLSHDLRTPLNKINTYIDFLTSRHRQGLCPEAGEYLANASKEIGNMKEIIEGLMVYSKLQTDPFTSGMTDLNEALGETISGLRGEIDKNRADIKAGRLPVVMGDKAQLTLLFKNLLDNALKFRGELPPAVNISAEKKEKEWIITVADNGLGIRPEDADRIFEIFQKSMSAEEIQGAGIGLAVSKAIIERHNGRIWAGPAGGGGSVFSFALPASD